MRVYLLMAALVISQSQQAQKMHEITVGIGGGLSTLQTSLTSGDVKSGFGKQIGLWYTYYFSPVWGISSGLELSDYQAAFSIPALSGQDTGQDPLVPGETYTLSYRYQLYEEKVKVGACRIPVMLQYNLREKLFISFGGKIAIPYRTTSSITAGSLETNGHFSCEDRDYWNVGYGLETFNNFSTERHMKLKPAFLLSLEAGMKWKLGKRVFAKTSVYADYGLNDMRSDTGLPAVTYSPESAAYLNHNSILLTPETKNMHLLAVGVKIRLLFIFLK
jgi:hypothetical protein